MDEKVYTEDTDGDLSYSRYLEDFEEGSPKEWVEKTCPACFGTGEDRYEYADCLECYGEGIL